MRPRDVRAKTAPGPAARAVKAAGDLIATTAARARNAAAQGLTSAEARPLRVIAGLLRALMALALARRAASGVRTTAAPVRSAAIFPVGVMTAARKADARPSAESAAIFAVLRIIATCRRLSRAGM